MTSPEFRRTAPAAPGDRDYFALFGFERTFDLDVAELERRYLELSKEAHPDRFVNAEPRERLAALQRSMRLNDAYKTLRKPNLRAEYLLACESVAIGQDDDLGAEFLMGVLELREELQETKLAADRDKLRTLEDNMLDRRGAALDRVADLFREIAGQGVGERPERERRKLLARIKEELVKVRYMNRYLDELDELDDEEMP